MLEDEFVCVLGEGGEEWAQISYAYVDYLLVINRLCLC